MSRRYKIKNITRLAKVLGKAVAQDADFSTKELKEYISVKNIKNMIKQKAKVDIDGDLVLSNEELFSVSNEIYDWLVGFDMCKLAAEGELECYWDNDLNEMVFSHAKPEE